MLKALQNLFVIPELRSRILVTLGLLVVYRLGWNIPLPGIDPEKLNDAMSAGEGDNTLVSFINIISGGGFHRASSAAKQETAAGSAAPKPSRRAMRTLGSMLSSGNLNRARAAPRAGAASASPRPCALP